MAILLIFQNHSSAKTTVQQNISAQKCLDSFLNKISLDGKIKTNPGMFKKILDQDFYLSDFSEKDRLFHKYLKKSQDIAPLISSIKNAILNHHPAIQELICKIEEDKIIQNIGKTELKVINNTIYRILILDIILK